jgi:Iron-sulfur cluster binding domain of dihydroorotate dehydrogenase B
MTASIAEPQLTIIEKVEFDLHASPGQFFLYVPPGFDPYLPQPLFPFRLRGGLVESFIALHHIPTRINPDDQILGPFGNGFALGRNTRRALLLAQNGAAGALLLPLVGLLVARDCEVAVLCGSESMPESWLPPEVEYHVADDILTAASRFWVWTDALYASGHMSFYDELLAAVKDVRLRLETGWGQLFLYDLAMPCGTGVCYLCGLKSKSGLKLNCRDGPVHDLADWTIEP